MSSEVDYFEEQKEVHKQFKKDLSELMEKYGAHFYISETGTGWNMKRNISVDLSCEYGGSIDFTERFDHWDVC